jgi:hypothetical protein
MKTVGLLLYLLFILPVLGQSIEDDDIVIATVGDDSITRGEFVNRLLMTIWPEKHRKGYLNEIKRQFLYSMIAERLLAKEAERVSSDRMHTEQNSSKILKLNTRWISSTETKFTDLSVPRNRIFERL